MNRKFLDILYDKLSVIRAEERKGRLIKDFEAASCDKEIHKERMMSLSIQAMIISGIIDDYINVHGGLDD